MARERRFKGPVQAERGSSIVSFRMTDTEMACLTELAAYWDCDRSTAIRSCIRQVAEDQGCVEAAQIKRDPRTVDWVDLNEVAAAAIKPRLD